MRFPVVVFGRAGLALALLFDFVATGRAVARLRGFGVFAMQRF